MTAPDAQPLTPDQIPELIDAAAAVPRAVAVPTRSRRQKAKQSASDLSDSATTTPDTTTAEPTTEGSDFVTTFDVNFDDDRGFTFDQDYKLKSAFKLPLPPANLPEDGEFWAVVEKETGRLFGPYMTENAALSLIQEDGVDGAISRMVLR